MLWCALSAVHSSSAFLSPSNRRAFTSKMSASAASTMKASADDNSEGRNIVVIGGGIQGTSCAFQLHQSPYLPEGSTITILESQKLA